MSLPSILPKIKALVLWDSKAFKILEQFLLTLPLSKPWISTLLKSKVPISTLVILTNLLGTNIIYTYYENRNIEKQEYNEYLFYIIFLLKMCPVYSLDGCSILDYRRYSSFGNECVS